MARHAFSGFSDSEQNTRTAPLFEKGCSGVEAHDVLRREELGETKLSKRPVGVKTPKKYDVPYNYWFCAHIAMLFCRWLTLSKLLARLSREHSAIHKERGVPNITIVIWYVVSSRQKNTGRPNLPAWVRQVSSTVESRELLFDTEGIMRKIVVSEFVSLDVNLIIKWDRSWTFLTIMWESKQSVGKSQQSCKRRFATSLSSSFVVSCSFYRPHNCQISAHWFSRFTHWVW